MVRIALAVDNADQTGCACGFVATRDGHVYCDLGGGELSW